MEITLSSGYLDVLVNPQNKFLVVEFLTQLITATDK